MKRLSLFLFVILLAMPGHAAAQPAKDTPRVWEAPLVLPTYELNRPTLIQPCSIGSDVSGDLFIHTHFSIRSAAKKQTRPGRRSTSRMNI